MIDEVTVEVDGRTYLWAYDPQIALAEGCWNWSDPKTFMMPPAAFIAALNQQFIQEHAERIADELDEAELPRFYAILRSMGARDIDFSTPALESAIKIADPNKSRELQFSRLPSAGHTPYNCPALRDWVFGSSLHRVVAPQIVTLIGEGPFDNCDLRRFLKRSNVLSIPIEWEELLKHDNDLFQSVIEDFEESGIDSDWIERLMEFNYEVGLAVVGRDGWSEDQIDEVIERRRGKSLRIYSQEMVVTMLHTGLDPFMAGPDVLEAFRAGHPALEFVSYGWAGWVGTNVPYDRSHNSSLTGNSGWQNESPLHVLGYRVGKSGLSSARRQSILGKAFEEGLPNVGSFEYMQQWGDDGSTERLHKIANLLASSCRNMKQRSSPSVEAIADWEHDLGWLKHTYYRGHMTFSWPDTFV